MTTPITNIKGVGVQTAEVLAEFGFKYAEDLLAADVDALVKVPGFGPARATMIVNAAKELCESAGSFQASVEETGQSVETIEESTPSDLPAEQEKKEKSKKKKKKKDKKKKKVKDEKKSRKAGKEKPGKKTKKTKKSKKSGAKKKKKK